MNLASVLLPFPRSRGVLAAIASVALLAQPAWSQWIVESPIPTALDVRGVAAPSAGRIFLATDDDPFDTGGALFESADGGATWTQRPIPESLTDGLNGLMFLDALTGWAYGNVNYRTTDGGATWTELPLLGSTYAFEFFTPSFGMASGNFGLLVSLDAGASWVPSPSDQFAFDFRDASTGLGVSSTGIHRTTDGGASFTPVHAGDARAVAWLSATAAVAIVDGGFARSTDGGLTWVPGAAALGRTELTAVSPSTVLAWGRGGDWPDYDDRVLRSTDGGQSWTDLGEVMPQGTLAVVMPAAPVVVAADLEGNLHRSGDGGATWTRTFSSPPGLVPGFFGAVTPVFATASIGYFAYGPGFVLKTTDGGASWSQVSSGSGRALRDVTRLSGGGLVAVGEGGTVLTSAGTPPWRWAPGFTSAHLTAVHAVSAQHLVAVEEAGRVHRSTDAGASWTAGVATPPGLSAADVHFSTALDGWVIGSSFGSGALFHTLDGGDTWSPVPDFEGVWVAVDFEGSNGWAASSTGQIHRTIDGGATWSATALPGFPSVNDVEFFDPSVGYAVGWYGFAARSDDAGMTWEVLPTPDVDQLSDIHLIGANELWVSTRSGRVWHSATGGQSWTVLPVGNGTGSFEAIAAVPGGDAWVAGHGGAIARFTGPPPPPANRLPSASFTFAPTGLTVAFTDASSDADGTIVSWLWDFGDGTTADVPNPTHTFAAANTYIVRLTVTDDDSAAGSAVRFIVVQPGPGGTFGEFTEVTPPVPPFITPQDEDFWISSTAPADYDGDGDLDFAVFGYHAVYFGNVEHRLTLMRNDGPASPTLWSFGSVPVPLGSLTAGSSDLAWGDVDNDGDQDLAIGSDGATVIYRNDAGTLVATDTALPPYGEDNSQSEFDLRSISWADFDNDGDLDLLVPSVIDAEAFAYRTALMRNDGPNGTGGWTFTETDSVFAATVHAQSAWADDDGDGDLDLLLVNVAPFTDESFVRRYRNDGAGAFVGEDVLGGVTVERGEAQWGDHDNDGDLDIMLVGILHEPDDSYVNALRVYRKDAGVYTPFEVIACVPCEGWLDLSAATWADYDSDGDVDILLAGSYNAGTEIEGRARVYDNVGGVFTDSGNELPAPRASASHGGAFAWLDLDGEGDLDYWIAGEYFVPGGNGLIEAQMHVYRNDAAGQNLAPSAPSSLAANVGGGNAVLSWTPASDDKTPPTALTYDLEVYRDGVPSGSAPRYLPQPGRVGAVTQWDLSGLPDGNYAWRLRAVDSAYNGGPLAQGSFVVGEPVIVTDLPRQHAFAMQGPNPMRHGTAFRFSVPERSTVDLAIYDLAGRRVARLAGGVKEPGVHEVTWSAGTLENGVYFVRYSAGRFSAAERVVVLR